MNAVEPPVFDRPGPRLAWLPWFLAAVIVAGLGLMALKGYRAVQRSSAEKAMLGNLRQLSAALDQMTIEEGYRIFFRYDELVGPDRYLKTQPIVAGESYSAIMPTRAGLPLRVEAPNGWSVTYDPEPPATAPREGVVETKLDDGRRYETTWQDGVPHGPFRAYYADGKLWGEATFEKGRVVGPAWLYTRDGRKFDELKDGPAAVAAVLASVKFATEGGRAEAEARLRRGDHAGAVEMLDQVLQGDSLNPDLYRMRAAAHERLGNLDAAIADLIAAEGHPRGSLGTFIMPERLRALVLRRAQQHHEAGRHAEARRDWHALACSAIWQADEHLRTGNARRAIAVVSEIERHYALAELLAARAEARRLTDDFAGAQADYTRAIELAGHGEMQIPANRATLPPHWRYRRGHVRRLMGDLPGAADDFRAARPGLGFAAAIQQPEAAMWLFLVRCEQGQSAEAKAEFAALDKSEWHSSRHVAAKVLLGETAPRDYSLTPHIPKDAVIVGIFRQVSGDPDGAKEFLRRIHPSSWHDDLEGQIIRRALAATP